MILAPVAGIVLGFFLSIPPGPISVAIIKKGIQGERETGRMIGAGAAGIDILYALVAAFASSAIVTSLGDFLKGNLWFALLFQIACIVILVILGYRYFHATADDLAEIDEEEKEEEEKARRFGAKSGIMIGVFMALMNMANPSFLPAMITVAGALHAEEILDASLLTNTLYAIGFGLGVFLWFILLLKIVISVAARMPLNYFNYVFRFAGGAFYLFAAIILVRMLLDTEWSKLLA